MIVTCPGCGSKYRVRDEAVPQGGAELKCPSCQSVFVAHPPKHSEEELAGAVERITRARDTAEQRVVELEDRGAELERRLAAAERRARDAEARGQQLEAQLVVLKSELGGLQAEALARLQPFELEVTRLREENGRAMARLAAAADAEVRMLQLTEELARARAQASHAPELDRLRAELDSAQTTIGRLATELEVAREAGAAGQVDVGAGPRAAQLEAELKRLQDELARSNQVTPRGTTHSLLALVSAVGPMLWGLEQAIAYLEPFGTEEPALAGHVQKLRLLEAVLKRLAAETTA